MATREDGEFELVLGNKQLLSVLFIVIVLLGVFFAMGFIAGRSTGPAGPQVADRSIGAAEGTPAEKRASDPAPVPITSEPSLAPPPAASVSPSVAESQTAAPPKPEAAKTAPAAPQGKSGFVEKPGAGIYLQVAAARQADAEAMHAMLLTHGLKGCVTPAPKNPELMRVLVGPFSTKEQVAPVREKLKSIGIDKAYTVSYE
jgi:cell division protein FtsN